jgi:hypothetical protein
MFSLSLARSIFYYFLVAAFFKPPSMEKYFYSSTAATNVIDSIYEGMPLLFLLIVCREWSEREKRKHTLARVRGSICIDWNERNVLLCNFNPAEERKTYDFYEFTHESRE